MRAFDKLRNRLLLQRLILLREVAQLEDAVRWLDTRVKSEKARGAKKHAGVRNRHPSFKGTHGRRTGTRSDHGLETIHTGEPGQHSDGLG